MYLLNINRENQIIINFKTVTYIPPLMWYNDIGLGLSLQQYLNTVTTKTNLEFTPVVNTVHWWNKLK